MKFLFRVYLCSMVLSCVGRDRLSEADIREIYQNFVVPYVNENYAKLYVPLPLYRNKIPHWQWDNKDFPRVIALLEFERFVIEKKLSCQKGLAMNGKDPEWHYLPVREIIQIDYVKNPKDYDLHCLKLDHKDFDFVMLNQTLEHVYDPILCLENVYNHMRPGGILYLNVPANNIPHETPFHYCTGYTPVGLGALVKCAGFKILSIGQWGNKAYLHQMFLLNDWPDYKVGKNMSYNHFDCPIITWVFAIKQ